MTLRFNMKSPSKRSQTLDKLRSAIQEMILDREWNQVSVQDIAQHANVSIGTFYNYFDSKDTALMDVRKVLSDVLFRDLDLLLTTHQEIDKRLTLLVKYFISLTINKPKWASYLYGGNSFCERLEGGIRKALKAILIEGVSKRVFRVNDIDITTEFIESGLFFIIRNRYLTKQSLDEDFMNEVANICLNSVGIQIENISELSLMSCPVTPLTPLPISTLAIAYDDMEFV
ncbi:TetR/AcrR family transcriptional regulator [Marinomonas spartinae]|uniref:TetR/AcrR family transcriptional regulator n=1 Tax=Marinomonas spartinae TaxID=1792290 RepID=UPI0018F20C3C|nr:TetR/AcrR family transcriptional regulator [Marinomonas spartinae]MBJ7554032.1 TetR/AcrR family transcriptional regulator [Marinomonas spartinae]